jgi:hypothetical protein
MNKNYIFIYSLLFFIYTTIGYSQIGMGTDTPNGILEIASTNSGLVYPIVSLTRTDLQTIFNPNTGLEIADGTTVYNTNTSSNGVFSVYEGLYTWDATDDKWRPQFKKKDYTIRSQNVDLRTISGTTTQTLDFDNSTFIPKFSGVYKITLNTHFGGGQVRNPNTGNFINFAPQEGDFTFTINSNIYSYSLLSYSGQNRDDAFVGSSTITRYFDSYTQASYIIEETLVAGVPYPFILGFAQAPAPDFSGNGVTGSGQGYIFDQGNVNCTVEFEFINE